MKWTIYKIVSIGIISFFSTISILSLVELKKNNQSVHYLYKESKPLEIRFYGEKIPLTLVKKDDQVQEEMDKNPSNAVSVEGGRIITGHKEGGFGKLVLLKNGDSVEITNNFGLKKHFVAKEVLDVRLDNLGTGGVVRNKQDSKKINKWKNDNKMTLLQTCLEVGANDYLVRIVAIEEEK